MELGITKRDIPGLMLEACPSFRPAYTESCAKYGEDNMLYVHAGALARHVLALHRAGQRDEFSAVAAFIERLHTEGSHDVVTFAMLGILRSIQNVWMNNDERPDAFLPFIGPLSTASWREVTDFRSPVYDVSDYFPEKIDPDAKRFPITLAYELQGHLLGNPSMLLPAEITVRDFCGFDSANGNGFAVHLAYGGGPDEFIRGLNAARAIGAVEHLKLMEEAKTIIERHGLRFPDPLPEPWWDPDEGIGFGIEALIEADLGDLNGRYYELHPHYKKTKDVYITLLEYVYSHRDELTCRKLQSSPPTLPPPLPPPPTNP